MSQTWKQLDLEGGGLQSANLALARRMKRPAVAYLLWLAFPLGLHGLYLADRRRAAVYAVLTAAAAALALAATPSAGLIPLAAEGLLALYDLFWIDRRLPALNKQIRMQVYLGQGSAPPSGYRGRYTDGDDVLREYVAEKERERAGHQKPGPGPGPDKKPPSFAEQEARLRELSRRQDNT